MAATFAEGKIYSCENRKKEKLYVKVCQITEPKYKSYKTAKYLVLNTAAEKPYLFERTIHTDTQGNEFFEMGIVKPRIKVSAINEYKGADENVVKEK